MSDIEKEIEELREIACDVSAPERFCARKALVIIGTLQAELASIKQQVVFVDEGAKAKVGDLVRISEKKDSQCKFCHMDWLTVINNKTEKAIWHDYIEEIIQRAGKPVLVRK